MCVCACHVGGSERERESVWFYHVVILFIQLKNRLVILVVKNVAAKALMKLRDAVKRMPCALCVHVHVFTYMHLHTCIQRGVQDWESRDTIQLSNSGCQCNTVYVTYHISIRMIL